MIDDGDIELLRLLKDGPRNFQPSGSDEESAGFDDVCERLIVLHESGYISRAQVMPNHMGGQLQYSQCYAGRITPAGRAVLQRHEPPDSEVVEIIRRKIAHNTEDRRRAFQDEYDKVTVQYSKRGALHSSMYMSAVDKLVEQELERRGRAVLAIWQAVLSGQGRVLTPEVAKEIKLSIAAVLRDQAIDVRDTYLRSSVVSERKRIEADFERHAARVQEHLETEVEFARVGGITPPPSPAEGTTIMNDRSIHIQGNVIGNVMGGESATATMTVTLAAPERDELVDALQELASAVATSAQGKPDVTTALQETIEQAVQAVRQPKVNRLTVGGLLSVISSVVRIIAEAPNATDAVRSAYAGLQAIAASKGWEIP